MDFAVLPTPHQFPHWKQYGWLPSLVFYPVCEGGLFGHPLPPSYYRYGHRSRSLHIPSCFCALPVQCTVRHLSFLASDPALPYTLFQVYPVAPNPVLHQYEFHVPTQPPTFFTNVRVVRCNICVAVIASANALRCLHIFRSITFATTASTRKGSG
jgi:hypothetical protein